MCLLCACELMQYIAKYDVEREKTCHPSFSKQCSWTHPLTGHKPELRKLWKILGIKAPYFDNNNNNTNNHIKLFKMFLLWIQLINPEYDALRQA